MVVHINDNLLVSDIKERFSKCYHYLKIEFYSRHLQRREKYSGKYIISEDKRIGEMRIGHEAGDLQIKSWYTADHMESEFREKFGLNVQVFRKENGRWVRTAKADKFAVFHQTELVDHSDTSIFPKFNDQWCGYDHL